MIKKLRNVVISLLICILIIWNKNIVPIKREITQLQLTQSIGFDIAKDGKYILSFLSNQKTTSSSEQSSSGGSSNSSSTNNNQKIEAVEASTFNSALKQLEEISAKYVPLSHVKYVFVGEDIAKEDLTSAIDFIAREEQARINAEVFIVKDYNAKYFLENETNKDYELEDRLKSMKENSVMKSIYSPIEIIDVMNILMSDTDSGVIPSIKILTSNNQNNGSNSSSNNGQSSNDKNSQEKDNKDEKKEITGNVNINEDIINVPNSETKVDISTGSEKEAIFAYDGYAVIKSGKLVGYISREESIMYNLLKSKFQNAIVNIVHENGQKISFMLKDYKVSLKFEFSNDHLKSIDIDAILKANIEEVDGDIVISDQAVLKNYEKEIDELLSKNMKSLFSKVREFNCDFINIREIINVKNPYKFQKIKDNWIQELENAQINTKVETEIRRTYDIVNIKGAEN